MQKQLLPEAEGYAKNNVRRRIWRRFVRVMACVVVFCTTYALILPAITMERNGVCELEEHTHTDNCYSQLTSREMVSLRCTHDTLQIHSHTQACYGADGQLVCGLADFVVHEHNGSCLDAEGNLVCTLPVIRVHEHTDVCYLPEETTAGAVHEHDESCYTQERGELLCQLDTVEPHVHTDACGGEKVTSCGMEEAEAHSHTEECENKVLTCEATVEPHIHGEGCYVQLVCELAEDENHTHSEACSGKVLSCDLTEQPHVHGEGCYQVEYLCGLAEGPGHVHEDTCYCVVYNCGLEEGTVHEHDDSCYEMEEVLICEAELTGSETEPTTAPEETERELICQEQEIILHSHTDACYEIHTDGEGNEVRTLICESLEVREHIHGEGCFVTEEVPVDTEALTCTLPALHSHSEACYDEAGVLICTEPTEAHSHGEACYDEAGVLICTEPTEGHVHGTMCYGTWVLTCGLEEHTHTEECTALLGLPEEDRAKVEEVIALIDPLPTYDEIAAKLDAFYEADDAEGEEAYLMEVYAQVEDAYRAYMALDESLREYVTNADKLMDLEFIWSQITLETAPTADAREDDLWTVSGGGIRFGVFDYINDKINKTSDGTQWRQIQQYFNFRDSRSNYGSDPTQHDTDHSQNEEHDEDGYTIHHATVERLLVNGMPILDLTRNADGTKRTDPGLTQAQRSLAYLFSSGDYAVKAYYPTNTILQKNGNHYWYDSRSNAVDYDVNSNLFRVRNYAEINEVTSQFTGCADFLPFTYTDGKVVGTHATTNVDYHVAYADVNYWFGMTMEISFFQTKDGQIDGGDMIFNFSGDDDVWVFIDDVLVLDLGGTHGTVNGSINFATGEVKQYLNWSGATEGSEGTSFPTTIRACFDAAGATPNGGWNEDGTTLADYTEHTLKFFYMERGAAVANCKLDFRLPTLPDKSLTVTKDLAIDGNEEVKSFLEDTLVYKFRVMKADENGNPTDEFFVKPGMTYIILSGGSSTGTGTVAADGTFSLRPGQSAQFTDMLVKGGGAVEYVVQEIMPDNLTGQYSGVEYEVSGQGGQTVQEEGPTTEFTSFDTGILSAESTQTVTFRNKVNTDNLSILKLTKEVADGAEFEAGKTFQIQVKLGGQLLPVGTEYQIEGGDKKTVTTAGIVELQIGQTATILEGIISGTEFEVAEIGAETGGFTPAYSGTLKEKDGSTSPITCTANGASGAFTLNSTAHVTVTNANYDFSGQIPIYKQALDNTDPATFRFLVERGTWADGIWTAEDQIPGAEITVSDGNVHGTTLTIGYKKNTNRTFFYRITEQRGTGPYIYDSSFYIVEVEVVPEGTDGMGTVTVKNIWKNGTALTDTILFTNRRTTDLIVTKDVTGAIYNGLFTFEAVVTLNGAPVALPQPTDGSYTVEGNKATFQLGHGGAIAISGIPYHALVTVTETKHDGFTAYYRISGEHTEDQLGDSVQVSFGTGTRTVEFINDGGYELPSTGGAGTHLYTMGGLLLMTAAAILLYIHNLKRRKEDLSSF